MYVGKENLNSQLQERQIRIAVIGALLALLGDIVLEYGRRFGIISVEAVEYGFNVLGPVGRIVKGYAHGCGWWCGTLVGGGCRGGFLLSECGFHLWQV